MVSLIVIALLEEMIVALCLGWPWEIIFLRPVVVRAERQPLLAEGLWIVLGCESEN